MTAHVLHRTEIDAFKRSWPCHGLPDNMVALCEASTVISGPLTAQEQMAAGLPAGFPVYYARGANNIANLIIAWKYMGFVVNENTSMLSLLPNV